MGHPDDLDLADELDRRTPWYLAGLEERQFRVVSPMDITMVVHLARRFDLPLWLIEDAADLLQRTRRCPREEAYARLLCKLSTFEQPK